MGSEHELILVIGATGNVGSRLVDELRQRAQMLRVFVRDRERGASLGADLEVAIGDLADRASLDAAMDGVDQVFLVSPNQPEQVNLEIAAIESAAKAGVRRLVKVSALGAEVGSTLSFWDWQGRIEQVLEHTRVPAVILRPTFYMLGLLQSADQVTAQGMLFAPAGTGRVAMIDPADVARVGASVLVDGGHDGEVLELTGPTAVSHDDIAAILTELTGRDVNFVDVPREAAREQMVAAGTPPFVADSVVELYRLLGEGAQDRVTRTVMEITGRPPTSVADFLAAHAGAFR